MLYPDDGDFARAYGRVAIEFATLEDRIDTLLREVAASTAELRRPRLECCLEKGTFTRKVRVLRKELRYQAKQPNAADRIEIVCGQQVLEVCLTLADERNDAFHSPIVADLQTGNVARLSKRYGDQIISSEEIYALARQINSTNAGVLMLTFTLKRLFCPPRMGPSLGQLEKLFDDRAE